MSDNINPLLCGSLRVILLVSCLIFAFNRLRSQEYPSSLTIRLPGSRSDATSSYYRASGLILAVLGSVGSFYRSVACLKLFVYLELLNVAALSVLFYSKSDATIANENRTFFLGMSRLMPAYDIRYEHGPSRANRKWDELQNQLCCGLMGPHDWDRMFREQGVYPSSCCHPLHRPWDQCTKDNGLVSMGCVKRVENLRDQWSSRNFSDVSNQVILCLIAFLLARCYEFSLTPQSQVLIRPVETRLEQITSQMDRFKLILLRRNSDGQKIPTKTSRLVKRYNYSDPPPAYGAC